VDETKNKPRSLIRRYEVIIDKEEEIIQEKKTKK